MVPNAEPLGNTALGNDKKITSPKFIFVTISAIVSGFIVYQLIFGLASTSGRGLPVVLVTFLNLSIQAIAPVDPSSFNSSIFFHNKTQSHQRLQLAFV